ncbi:MAG TPA: ABC transporter ATP-binding protein [Mycobacteriales bacterium]|nr:ABC transporter ATP-binding protein [Mycobacteriales bacterium]
MTTAISVENLVVRYGPVTAVAGISFDVAVGEVFALLGPNGAGKTSTLEVLEGYRRRAAGAVSVLGYDPQRGSRALRERIGVVLQSCGVDQELTVRELVNMYAALYAHHRAPDETIELVGLADKADARTRTLSGGQLRRLDLALAVVADPELLFLDEPTTGFDPNARHAAWDMVDGLREAGTTIVLTSHYLDEVQRLADRIIVLRQGLIVSASTPSDLAGRDRAESTIRIRSPFPGWEQTLPDGPWVVVPAGGDEVLLRTARPTDALFILTRWATQRGEELPALAVEHQTLEDAYLQLTGGAKGFGHDPVS